MMSWSLLKLLILTAFCLAVDGLRLRYESLKINKCPPRDYSCCMITHCPAAWTLFNAGIQPTICGWKYKTPFVCCPRYIHQEQLHDDEDLFPAEEETEDIEKKGPSSDSFPATQEETEDIEKETPSPDSFLVTEEETEDIKEETPSSIEQKSSFADGVNPQQNAERKSLIVSKTSAGNCGVREVDPSSDIPESAIREIDDSYDYDSTDSPNTRPPEIVVVGGTPVNQKWSWMAGIYNRNSRRPFCGGTIIDDKHILTAAHCFDPKGLNASQYTVKLGEVDLLASNPSYEIDKIKVHENYQPQLYYDDIAIVRLKERIPDDLITICVPEEDNLNHGDNVTVLGWGQLSYGGRSTNILQEAQGIPIVRNRDCNAKYENLPGNQFPNGITENMICAGHEDGGVDSCRGDSGGPLLREYKKDNWALVGIISFGFRCAEPGFPGVYTRVVPYLPWVRKYIDDHISIDWPKPVFVPYNPSLFSGGK